MAEDKTPASGAEQEKRNDATDERQDDDTRAAQKDAGAGGSLSEEGGVGATAPGGKHPLEHKWTLWYDNPNQRKQQGQGNWGQSLKPVYTFNTVEDFWCLFNNVLPPSRLVIRADMHVFKKGIEPKWEDAKCASGGAWTVNVAGKPASFIDAAWLNLVLASIGEQFEHGDDICGCVVNIRQGKNRLSLWTKTASNEAVQKSIGTQLKEFLDISDKVSFTAHEDAKLNKNAARYIV